MVKAKAERSGQQELLESLPEFEETLREDHVLDDSANERHAIIKYDITSYGADYTVDSLVARLKNESFFIPPFQRAYVWTQRQASRFIETLLLGLPVPGVFVSKEDERTGRHLVIDGQQRLKSLEFFYQGYFKNKDAKFRLIDVDPEWEGKSIDDLSVEDRRRLDDSIIHTTVFQQTNPKKDNTSVYHVFERINTGGSKLQPQEIRSCVYYGSFIKFLSEINETLEWRAIFGKTSSRLKDQELILRFLALEERWEKYSRPMNEFLNTFTADYRDLSDADAKRLGNKFMETIRLVFSALGNTAFRPERTLNAAVFDAVMVGIAHRLKHGPVSNQGKRRHGTLIETASSGL